MSAPPAGHLLPASHDSFQRRRLKKYRDVNPERVYIAEWKKLNRERLSGGWTYIEHILAPDGNTVRPVSRRDMAVAASVIQWLGTNCGLAFIKRCEGNIEALRVGTEEARRAARQQAIDRHVRALDAAARAAADARQLVRMVRMIDLPESRE